jgi:sulfur relay (sulfurtransferase) DsrF/TusC family protein
VTSKMSARVTVSLSLAVLFIAIVALAARAQQKPEQLAQQSATNWLALIDSGKYAKGWEEAASLFQAHVSRDQWQSALHAARDPLGKLISRKLASATYTKTLPGAPDGEYVVLKFESSFEHKQSAIETVTPMREMDGSWKVSGYLIK